MVFFANERTREVEARRGGEGSNYAATGGASSFLFAFDETELLSATKTRFPERTR